MGNSNTTIPPDALLQNITDYVLADMDFAPSTYETAAYCLTDSLGCALASLENADCRRAISPLFPGIELKSGISLPGLPQLHDPVTAAFKLGSMIRWLDFNDTWLAKEWAHPSDNLAALIATALYLEQQNKGITLGKFLKAMVKAYEIQGCLALENSFNQLGLDHVILVRIASAAVSTTMLGGSAKEVFNAISNAWADGGALRNYRHAPDAGSRKSWAAGDASARGLWHAFFSMGGEMGYPHVLSTPRWGFSDSLMRGQALVLRQELASYVMDNILFKVCYPAEFHAQTAIEAAIELHNKHHSRLDDIEQVQIETQQAANLIINKTGKLENPAARDHCLQYMVAVALINGNITASDYSDKAASLPLIDVLRLKMKVSENGSFTRQYHDAELRAITNALQLFFNDGSKSERIEIRFPLGHRKRRNEAWPFLEDKFRRNCQQHIHKNNITFALGLLSKLDIMQAMPFSHYFSYYLNNQTDIT